MGMLALWLHIFFGFFHQSCRFVNFLLESFQDSMGIRGSLHGLRLRVESVFDRGNVPAQLFHQSDQLGDLLFCQQVDLQIQLCPSLRQKCLPVLRNQHHDCQQ